MTDSKYKHYLHDLGILIKEEAREAKQQCDIAVNDRFTLGELLTWYRVVSLMQQQAQAFGIDLKDLRLDDIDPDSDLV